MSVDLTQAQIDNDYTTIPMGDNKITQFGGTLTTFELTQAVVGQIFTETVINSELVLLLRDGVYYAFRDAKREFIDAEIVNIIPGP